MMTKQEQDNGLLLKVVVWNDGAYKIVYDSNTVEYENDKDWLVTIPIYEDEQSKKSEG